MKKIFTYTDQQGDIFVNGFNKYINGTLAEDHLNQLVENFEDCFEVTFANPDDLKAGMKFVWMFLAEIGERYPKSKHAHAASIISGLIDEDDPVKTAENIASLYTPPNY